MRRQTRIEKPRKSIYGRNYLYLLAIFLLFFFCLLKLPASPLRSGNTWDDTNAMLRMGQLWANGHIPFKDAFEQRGPIMYLLYLLANLISRRGYIGLFIIEVANALAIQFMIMKIFKYYFHESKPVLTIFVSLAIPLLAMSNFSFKNGGSPEEFSIVWILMSVYGFHQYLRTREVTNFFLVGLGFAVVFNIKYSLIGPWLGIALMTLFYIFNSNVKLKRAFYQLMWVLFFGIIGILTIVIPLGVYFWLFRALKRFIHVYFVVNLTAYPKTNFPFYAHVLESLAMGISGIANGHMITLLLFLIAIFWLRDRKLTGRILVVFVCTSCLSFWALRPTDYSYYVLIFIMIFSIVLTLVSFFSDSKSELYSGVAFVLVTLFFIVFSTYNNPSLMLAEYGKNSPANAAYKFAKIIKRRKVKPSVLYYSVIDFGIARYLEVPATSYYFERTNLTIDSQKTALDQSVKKRKTEFIVVKKEDARKKIVKRNYYKLSVAYKYKYLLVNNYRIKLIRIPLFLMQKKS